MSKRPIPIACGPYWRRLQRQREGIERERHDFETITAAALMAQYPEAFPDRSSALREARRMYARR